MRKNSLNRFNNGGSHDSNKLGGIPLNVGSNGQLNTSQEGETMQSGFVFSNDIKLTKDVIKEYNLPSNLEGKTIASATKYIDNKFKDRNDKISLSTKNGMLDGIAKAQESIKAKRDNLSKALDANSTEVPDQMDGQVPDGFEIPQNQMFLGGNMGGNSMMGNIMGGVSSIGNSIGDSGFAERYNYDPKLKAQYQQMEGIKDGIAGAFGPYGQLFRGIEKAGKGIGTAIGGETGGDVASGILDPFSGQMETFKNKDATGWEKAAVVAAPFLSGVIAGGARNRSQQRIARQNHIMESGAYTNDFALGGNTREPISSVTGTDSYNNLLLNQDLIGQYSLNNALTPTTTNSSIPTSTYDSGYTSPYNKANLKPAVDWLGNNYGNILRYSPIVSNALQLKNLKPSANVRLNRLDNRFTPDYVDERSLQNIAGNELDNTTNALAGATNGSTGALRNSLLAASLNRNKALSDAYLNASAQNRSQNLQAQEFNRGTDQFNINQANTELDINDRNRAAYDTNKSRLISAIGEDLGNVGKEEVYKNIAKTMYGYRWDGSYWIKPDGSKATDAEVKSEVASNSNKNKLGGMLINKNKK